MGATNGFLVALGIGNGTLEHMKAVANSVKPDQIAHMSQVFSQGSDVTTQSHAHIESSIAKVVTGWKGQAAEAASTNVAQGAFASSQSSESSTQAHAQVQSFATQMAEHQSKINAIQPVDTSMSAAIQSAGGPGPAMLNPGAVAGHMAAAQAKSFQHREEAAGHLNSMDDASTSMASQFKTTYTPIKSPGGSVGNSLPARISVQPVHSSGGGGGVNVPNGPSGNGGSGGGPTGPGSGGSGTVHPIKSPTGTVQPVEPPTKFPTGPGTVVTGVNPTNPVSPVPPVALPEPVGGGGGGGIGGIGGVGGIVGGAILGGGLIGAGGIGGVGGIGRGGAGATASGNSGLTDEEARLRAGGRAGMAGEVGEDGSVLRGRSANGLGSRGFGGAGEEAPLRGGASELGRGGMGGRGFGGGLGEETPLRASGLSGGSAGELAAGERGMTPGGRGGAGRREDEDELNKRPDYLVETDDIWGDGRLAAPPVLG